MYVQVIYEPSAADSRFKLHLRSKFANGKTLRPNVPPLLLNKTVVDVLADFRRFLLHCLASYVEDTHPFGPSLWTSLQDTLYFVLSHPNGREGKERSQMREAAVKTGLIPDYALRAPFATTHERPECIILQSREGLRQWRYES